MKLFNTLSRIVLVAVFLGVVNPAGAQSASAVFERLKDKYDSVESLRAEFSQTMTSSYMDDEATSQGVLVIQGERYRVETDGQTLVTDGRVTWVYMQSENQVLINDYNNDEQTFSISEFLFDYDENYDASEVAAATMGGERHYVLTLTPKSDEAFFTEATLAMRDRDDLITELKVVDVNGTTMRFNLENIQLNPALQEDVFTFTPPQGTEVVDLRS